MKMVMTTEMACDNGKGVTMEMVMTMTETVAMMERTKMEKMERTKEKVERTMAEKMERMTTERKTTVMQQ